MTTKQSRTMSFVEALTNVLVGYSLAVLANYTILPLFSLHVTIRDSFYIAGIFTAIALLRSYTLRRAFEAIRARQEARRGKDTRKLA